MRIEMMLTFTGRNQISMTCYLKVFFFFKFSSSNINEVHNCKFTAFHDMLSERLNLWSCELLILIILPSNEALPNQLFSLCSVAVVEKREGYMRNVCVT